ncbi:MAG: DUF362 domain-containing protein [Thermodesulfobacteriota bacterium]|nr:DUF362 domain-containing protein [Thermodesulfobacteriota bacterium]
MHIKMSKRNFFKFLLGLSTFIFTSILFPAFLFQRRKATFFKGIALGKTSRLSSDKISKVVIVRSTRIQGLNGKIDKGTIFQMVDQGVRNLVSKEIYPSAWKYLFSPQDTVGIKVNCLGGRMFSPHIELIDAIIAGLISANVKQENIIVWDRLNRELRLSGFTINTGSKGVKCFGTDALGYDRNPEIKGSIGSCFSRIISSYCNAIISVPVLKDHDLSGVSISMKNFYGAIHNPNKYHDNNCDPYIADLNSHPYIKDKLRLIICDGITVEYNGGPGYNPTWLWNYNGLLIAQDPVALDCIGMGIIEKKRKMMGMESLKQEGREARHIGSAARLGLGTDRIDRIDILNLSV